jgi:hypothetical protein
MFSSLRDRFGTAGLVIGIMALIVALAGTAYAASTLTKGQKKEVEKIAKKYAGKPGAPGAPGAKGDTGSAGSNGSNGTNGKDGTPGTPGAPGKNVVLTTITTAGLEGNCVGVGGTKVEVEGSAASKKFICNGKEGPEGSPWTAGGTLPEGATETGSWLTTTSTEVAPGILEGKAIVSFAIPTTIPASALVVEVGETPEGDPETFPEACDDGEEPEAGPEHPEADPGFFCIFVAKRNGSVPSEAPPGGVLAIHSGASGGFGPSTTGSVLSVFNDADEEVWGTFAVTGEGP